MNNKFLSLLGMARKANMAVLGYEKALESLHKGKARLVITASDLSEKTRRGLVFAGEEDGVEVITVDSTIFELSNAVGQTTGIVCINNAGFAKKLKLLSSQTEKE